MIVLYFGKKNESVTKIVTVYSVIVVTITTFCVINALKKQTPLAKICKVIGDGLRVDLVGLLARLRCKNGDARVLANFLP